MIIGLCILACFMKLCCAQCRWVDFTNNSYVNSCTHNCYFSRRRLTNNGQLCNFGNITEVINDCGPLTDVCPNSYLVKTKVTKECHGNCDRSIESVILSCRNNRNCEVYQTRWCKNISTCSGEWSQWGNFGECNSTINGFRSKERRCLNRQTGIETNYCEGSQGRQIQTRHLPCSNLQVRKIPLNSANASIARCQHFCANTDDVITAEELRKKCDQAVTKMSSSHEKTCDYNKYFIISCSEVENESICSLAENPFVCGQHMTWSSWNNWHDEELNKSRIRHRCCRKSKFLTNSTFPLSFQMSLQIEKECNNDAKKHISNLLLIQWIIIILVVVIVLMIAFATILYLCKRKKEKEKRKRKSKLSAEKEVSINNSHEKEDGIQKRLENFEPKRLTVFDRINRISEHMYEAILKKSPTPSTSSDHMKDQNYCAKACDNIYKEEENSNMLKYPDRRDHPFCVSITVTDPDGLEIGKNVFGTEQTNAVEKSERTLDRKRWSKVPTPVLRTKDKFIQESSKLASTEIQIPSVRYSVVRCEFDGREPENLNLTANILTNETGHHYDAVPPDSEHIPSARSSFFQDGENSSIWSQSSFEGDDFYTPGHLSVSRLYVNETTLAEEQNDNDVFSQCLTGKLAPPNKIQFDRMNIPSSKYMDMTIQYQPSNIKINKTPSRTIQLKSQSKGSPFREVDQKYVTPNEVKGLRSLTHLPINSYGYLDLESASIETRKNIK